MAATELLARVLDAPEDEHLRLVYADLLQEQGDPRGELIILQLKRRREPLTALEAERESELLAQHGMQWVGRLASIAQYLEFEGGFLDACALREIPDWSLGERAWRTVRHLGVQRDAQRLPELLSSPHLGRLRSLRVSDDLLEPAVRAAPAQLEALIIDGGRASLAEALTSTRLGALKRVELRAPPHRYDFTHTEGGWRLDVTLKTKHRRSALQLPRALTELDPALVTQLAVTPADQRDALVQALRPSGG